MLVPTLTVMDIDGTFASTELPWASLLKVAFDAQVSNSLFFLTARDQEHFGPTKDWLNKLGIHSFGLIMRPSSILEEKIPQYKCTQLLSIINAYSPTGISYYEDNKEIISYVLNEKKKNPKFKCLKIYHCNKGKIREKRVTKLDVL